MNCIEDKISSYYYFDDMQKEVCFKRRDMPTPWMNYLSNGTFHTMISQAGGGLAFYKSPQIWRITRYRFFHLPTDRSGPYVYLKDNENNEYWCPTNEPAQLKPDKWEAAHGMGYTRFSATRNGLSGRLLYFVAPEKNVLVWNLKLKNTSAIPKDISLFAYVEFAMMEFMRELQWQCYNKHQVEVDYDNKIDALIYKYNVENQPKPEETPLVYLSSDISLSAYDGDRDEFIGSYRSESNPKAIENGGCTNSTLFGGDPCGALQFDFKLQPNEEKILNIFLGTEMTNREISNTLAEIRKPDFVERSFNKLKNNWDTYLNKFISNLPDKDIQRQVNIWNPYQSERNFIFSRNISYYATGTFRGVGFRDTSQDILSHIPFNTVASKDKIKLLLSQQYIDGHANHYFFPTEGWEPVTSVHSDDHLWPVLAVYDVVIEEGDISFLNEIIPYYDGTTASVYDHLVKAIDFTENNIGLNGFPLMLRSDWNDQLFRVSKEGKGESIWASMQLGTALNKMIELASLLGRQADVERFAKFYSKQKNLINSIGWDGKWFRRAIMHNDEFLGTVYNDQAKIWLNSQTWSIISGMAESDKAIKAMDSVKELLDTDLGIKKLFPAITNSPSNEEPLTNYNPGTGENGAIFCHANTWAIIAECMLNRPENAYKYYKQLIPNIVMEKAGIWRYKAEPYVYSSNIFGPESDKFGLANISWLTGTASWMYIAITQYILGIKPCWHGLAINPCIPAEWKGFEVTREFRGCIYHIKCERANEKSLFVDGVPHSGNIVPHLINRKIANVEVRII